MKSLNILNTIHEILEKYEIVEYDGTRELPYRKRDPLDRVSGSVEGGLFTAKRIYKDNSRKSGELYHIRIIEIHNKSIVGAIVKGKEYTGLNAKNAIRELLIP